MAACRYNEKANDYGTHVHVYAELTRQQPVDNNGQWPAAQPADRGEERHTGRPSRLRHVAQYTHDMERRLSKYLHWTNYTHQTFKSHCGKLSTLKPS